MRWVAAGTIGTTDREAGVAGAASGSGPFVPNSALRAHVSDHSFVLTLRKTHISHLVALANEDRDAAKARFAGHDWFVTAMKGLKHRGLIEHRGSPGFAQTKGPKGEEWRAPITNHYRLTRAGWAVFDLLVEAGLADALPIKGRKVAA